MLNSRTTLLSLTLVACSTCLQAGDPVEKVVDYRQGLMNVYAYNATSMGDMVKGKTDFDATAFARYAKDLAAAARLDLLSGFPEDSVNEQSDASDAIWLDWEKFQERYKALREQSAKLAEVTAGGDEPSMKEQFGATAKICKGCHDDFRD